jgi:hypothetical protein
MPNTGDYIRKEREGVDLIIGMHKKTQQNGLPVGELIVFVVLPLVIAGGIWKQKEIKDFAQHNDQVSQVIKMVYPEWKTAAELAPPPLPGDQAVITEPGQPLAPGAEPGTDSVTSPDTATQSPAGNAVSPPQVPATQQQVSPEYQGPAERGSLLH